jgi:hypothetical protein
MDLIICTNSEIQKAMMYGHVAKMGETKNAYTVFVGKHL